MRNSLDCLVPAKRPIRELAFALVLGACAEAPALAPKHEPVGPSIAPSVAVVAASAPIDAAPVSKPLEREGPDPDGALVLCARRDHNPVNPTEFPFNTSNGAPEPDEGGVIERLLWRIAFEELAATTAPQVLLRPRQIFNAAAKGTPEVRAAAAKRWQIDPEGLGCPVCSGSCDPVDLAQSEYFTGRRDIGFEKSIEVAWKTGRLRTNLGYLDGGDGDLVVTLIPHPFPKVTWPVALPNAPEFQVLEAASGTAYLQETAGVPKVPFQPTGIGGGVSGGYFRGLAQPIPASPAPPPQTPPPPSQSPKKKVPVLTNAQRDAMRANAMKKGLVPPFIVGSINVLLVVRR